MSFRYLAFYKPFRVLTQFTDPGARSNAPSNKDRARRTLADYIPIPGVYAAGRLDFDSEGLLLLTDDGSLQHRLTDPAWQHPRTYWVQVEGQAGEQHLARLRRGVEILGTRTRPCEARSLPEPPDVPPRDPPIRFRKSIPTSWIEITLREGRNRQVRRMTAAVGLPTLRLVRVAFGSITLEGLRPGLWRDLTTQDLKRLRSDLAKRPVR